MYGFDHDTNFPFGMGVSFKYSDKIDNSKVYIYLKDAKMNFSKIWFPTEVAPEVHGTPCFGLQVYKK